MTKFQIILTGIFAAFIIIGVAIFAVGGNDSSKDISRVTLWGTMTVQDFSGFTQKIGLDQNKTIILTYVEKNPVTFDQELVNALAIGQGPDIFFLPQDSILKNQDKVFAIPFQNYSLRDFKNNFIAEGELYLTSTGVLALPFTVDPLVMYWNRDIFSNASLSQVPAYWDEFFSIVPKITEKDTALNIKKTIIAFGEFRNISNAKEIISTLIMQAGSPITVRNEQGVFSALVITSGSVNSPAVNALNFYTDFANPAKSFYSWNRALPASKDYFLAGDSATYFGFASELRSLQLKNPNLNFDIASLPQSRAKGPLTTFGKMNGLAISKTSKNIAGAFRVVSLLTSSDSIAALVPFTILPPVRRDLLAIKPTDAYFSVFYDSAIRSRAWLDPDKDKTSGLFQEMIESITGGRNTSTESVNKINAELNLLFKGNVN